MLDLIASAIMAIQFLVSLPDLAHQPAPSEPVAISAPTDQEWNGPY